MTKVANVFVNVLEFSDMMNGLMILRIDCPKTYKSKSCFEIRSEFSSKMLRKPNNLNIQITTWQERRMVTFMHLQV